MDPATLLDSDAIVVLLLVPSTLVLRGVKELPALSASSAPYLFHAPLAVISALHDEWQAAGLYPQHLRDYKRFKFN